MFRGLVKWAVLLLAPAPAFAECTAAGIADIVGPVAEAERTFRGAQLEAFRLSTDRVVSVLPCVAEPIPPSIAAAIHRMVGLRAYVDEEPVRVGLAFGAARSVDPDYVFPADVIPRNNPVSIAYLAIPAQLGLTEPVLSPVDGYLQFDGMRHTLRPVTWPSVVQLFDERGRVRTTVYLWPGDPMPTYEPIAVTAPAGPGGDHRHTAKILWRASIGTGIGAVTTYGLALERKARYAGAGTFEEGEPFRRQANAFAVTAGALGLATVGLAVGGALTMEW